MVKKRREKKAGIIAIYRSAMIINYLGRFGNLSPDTRRRRQEGVPQGQGLQPQDTNS